MQPIARTIVSKEDAAQRYNHMSQKSRVAWDLFCICSGNIDKPIVDEFLSDGYGDEGTTIWINANACLDGKMLRYLAYKLPRLNEFFLHTCSPTKNEFRNEDLIAFAEKRPHIQYLALQSMPHVTSEGLLAMIRKMDGLVEFSTDFPIKDEHAKALLTRHPTLISIELTGRIHFLSKDVFSEIRPRLKRRQNISLV